MTTFDVIAAMMLGASASLVVTALLSADVASITSRLAAAGIFLIWYGAIVTLGALGAFSPTAFGGIGLGLAVLLPVLAGAYLGTNARFLEPAILALPLTLLISVHLIRVLGIDFILLYMQGRLPPPFAPVAGWGDIFIGLTALPVAWAAMTKSAHWRKITLIWNGLGLLDLIAAVGLGVTSAPGSPLRLFFEAPGTSIMSTLPWVTVPGFIVPLLMIVHLTVFHRLRHVDFPWVKDEPLDSKC